MDYPKRCIECVYRDKSHTGRAYCGSTFTIVMANNGEQRMRAKKEYELTPFDIVEKSPLWCPKRPR